MGTRADFYVGRGQDAEWLGSIAWDGYPSGLPGLVDQTFETEEAWRDAVTQHLAGRDDATLPEMGWPWPWPTSATTDYAYAWDAGVVYSSRFGGAWLTPQEEASLDADEYERLAESAEFPDMSDRTKLAMGTPRDSIMIVGL